MESLSGSKLFLVQLLYKQDHAAKYLNEHGVTPEKYEQMLNSDYMKLLDMACSSLDVSLKPGGYGAAKLNQQDTLVLAAHFYHLASKFISVVEDMAGIKFADSFSNFEDVAKSVNVTLDDALALMSGTMNLETLYRVIALPQAATSYKNRHARTKSGKNTMEGICESVNGLPYDKSFIKRSPERLNYTKIAHYLVRHGHVKVLSIDRISRTLSNLDNKGKLSGLRETIIKSQK